MDLGREEEAVRCWQDVYDADPTHPQVVFNLSLNQWRRGEIADDKVLNRLDNCLSNPSVDRELLTDLKALIHVARSIRKQPGLYWRTVPEV